MNKTRAALTSVLVFLVVVSAVSCSRSSPPVFKGDSTGLQQTQIVPTLDTPMIPQKNVIWCATMQAMWKTLEKDVIKEPPRMEKPSDECDRLNAASDPSDDMPAGSYYVGVGRIGDGIEKKIAADLKRLFPKATLPSLPANMPLVPNPLLGYSYLEASVRFTVPYSSYDKPREFRDSAGNVTGVHFFGMHSPGSRAFERLHKQAEILLYDPGAAKLPNLDTAEFALDLCRDSAPNQIVVACIKPENSLAETLESLERRIANAGDVKSQYFITHITVPEIHWDLIHRFSNLENNAFLNKGFEGSAFAYLEQGIRFKLDKGGAELSSHVWAVPPSMNVSCDAQRPFLVYIKKRGAKTPFFAMWIDNAELLRKE